MAAKLPVGNGLGLDVPVYITAGDLAERFGLHRNYGGRALVAGYLVPAAYLGDRPIFDEAAGMAGMRAFLASRPFSVRAREALDRAAVAIVPAPAPVEP